MTAGISSLAPKARDSVKNRIRRRSRPEHINTEVATSGTDRDATVAGGRARASTLLGDTGNKASQGK